MTNSFLMQLRTKRYNLKPFEQIKLQILMGPPPGGNLNTIVYKVESNH